MKLFTILFTAILLVSVPVYSSGQSNDSMEKDMAGSLTDFTDMESAMMMAESKPTVLFFHASWCPDCIAARKDFEKNSSQLENINLIVVDYDKSSDLKRKYNITYQHTFVQISPDGKELAKWNGGETEELLNMLVKQSM